VTAAQLVNLIDVLGAQIRLVGADFPDVEPFACRGHEWLELRAIGGRLGWRLQSPYLEHFSQAFARFFMRVGLPSAVPPFK
jgi:hypothetical protein